MWAICISTTQLSSAAASGLAHACSISCACMVLGYNEACPSTCTCPVTSCTGRRLTAIYFFLRWSSTHISRQTCSLPPAPFVVWAPSGLSSLGCTSSCLIQQTSRAWSSKVISWCTFTEQALLRILWTRGILRDRGCRLSKRCVLAAYLLKPG
jgi:hypothetical protein